MINACADPPRARRHPPYSAHIIMSHDLAAVKAELLHSFRELLDSLLDAAVSGELSAREAEVQTWKLAVPSAERSSRRC